jgi:N,N-dimethylformamidase
VFSVGSISWTASLGYNAYENNVSRITRNVLDAFISSSNDRERRSSVFSQSTVDG